MNALANSAARTLIRMRVSCVLLVGFGCLLLTACGGGDSGVSAQNAGRYWAAVEAASGIEKPQNLTVYSDSDDPQAYNGTDSAELLAGYGEAFTTEDLHKYTVLDGRAWTRSDAKRQQVEDTHNAADCLNQVGQSTFNECIANYDNVEQDYQTGLQDADNIYTNGSFNAQKKLKIANEAILADFNARNAEYATAIKTSDRPKLEFGTYATADLKPDKLEKALCPLGSYEFFITPDSVGTKTGGFIVLHDRNGTIDPNSGLRLFSCDEAGNASVGDPTTLEAARDENPGINKWFSSIKSSSDPTGYSSWPDGSF